jgi:hypothetical protein
MSTGGHMKQLIFILTLTISNLSFAAICECGAPPECGRSRPPNCKSFTGNSALSKFFANNSIQSQNPKAFALSSESREFVSVSKKNALKLGEKFISDISKNYYLYTKVLSFENQSIEEQINTLKEVFEFEVKLLKIQAPKLVIDTNYNRAAYFEFNFEDNSNGTVYINPKKTYDENRMISLSLLIHETRHAAQLQLAKANRSTIEGTAYRQSFMTQKKDIKGLSFSDFLTLNNEYEAFLFANYVFHKLFEGQYEMIDMGTFASQFDQAGNLKIDLEELHIHEHDVLKAFNKLMIKQKKLLGR